jgi:hypothetical protein
LRGRFSSWASCVRSAGVRVGTALELGLEAALGLGDADPVEPAGPQARDARTMARHASADGRTTDLTSAVVWAATYLYAPTALVSVRKFLTETAGQAT